MPLGWQHRGTRIGIWNSGAVTSSRSSAGPPALPKCRPPPRCWRRSDEAPQPRARHSRVCHRKWGLFYCVTCRGRMIAARALSPLRGARDSLCRTFVHRYDAVVKTSILFLRQRPVGDDRRPLNVAEPPEREVVALTRNGDRAIGTATAFLRLALGDDLDEEHVGFRRSDAGELSGAIEIRIFRFRSPGIDREFEFVRCLAADLGEFTAPAAVDAGRSRGRALLSFRRRLIFWGGRKLCNRRRNCCRGKNERRAAAA